MTLAQLPPDLSRWVSILGPARQLAEVLAETDFVPKAMRGKPDAVTAAIMYGDELGLGPMQALAGMDVVEGKPRPSAELARALILRDGHTLTVHDATGTRVRVSGLRAGRPESERVTIEWTMDMARAAGLVGKSNWRAYPRAMLMARATGDLARVLFPDVIKGLSYLGETETDAATLDGWAGPETTDPPAVAAQPVPAIQRKRAPRKVAEPVPAAPVEPPKGLPELAPETDPGSEPNPGLPVPEPARRALFAAIGKQLGPNAQRAERLALCSAILGRPVESSTDLGATEVSVLLDWLDAAAKGRATWAYDPDTETGRVRFIRSPEEIRDAEFSQENEETERNPTRDQPVVDVPLPEPPEDPWG